MERCEGVLFHGGCNKERMMELAHFKQYIVSVARLDKAITAR